MSEQSNTTKATIHQDILLRMATPGDSPSKRNSSNKKRRVTFSSLYLDEEPVFSDSEDEMEYMMRIFGGPNCTSPSKSPKSREVGIQCDIISDKETFIELIEKCLRLKPEVTTGSSVVDKYSSQLINLCKQIQDEMLHESEEFRNGNSKEDIFHWKQFKQNSITNKPVYTSSEEFLPSSCGTNNSLTNNINVDELVPKEPSVCDELLIKTEKKEPKKRSKRKHQVMKGTRKSVREKKSPEKKFKMDFGTVDKKNIGKKGKNRIKSSEFLKREPKSKNRNEPRQKINLKNAVPDTNVPNLDHISIVDENLKLPENMAKYLMDPEAHCKITLPKQLIKPLARNWMKPNKSFC